ncbi:MAG: T9SS type A sorting domain-containing protein [Bacteroidetes bacterium]|nr:T9SS type A sorting domain-containing protein [Bacteroidota bacterium]
MKKIYLLALLTLGAFTAKAQYTITASHNPVVGDVETTYDADTVGIPTGANGTGVTWNYTGIVISPTAAISSNTYVANTAAPNYTAFPSATIAQNDGTGTYSMWNYSSSAATLYGSASSTLNIVFSDPEIVYTLPFTYGSSSNDTYAGTFTVSGFPATISGTVTTTGVGIGTLQMPGGKTYTNVLKIKAVSHQVLSVPVVSYSSTTDNVNYVYISSVSKNSILTVGTSTTVTTSTTTTTTYNKTVAVNKDLQLSGIQEYKKDANFSLYPNPANTNEVSLFFVLTNDENYEVTLYNTMGQEIQKQNLGQMSAGMYNKTLDLSGLGKGMYYVKLKGKNAEGIQKLIVQ